MIKKNFANIFGYLLPILFLFGCGFAYFMLYYRYDAFPSEKRSAKNIEKIVNGIQFNDNLDYCKPDPYAVFCSENFSDSVPGCVAPICKWGHVKSLSLRGKKLRQLPIEDIANLSGLEWLDLGNNQLAPLPAEIGKLRNVDAIDLSSNQLTGLPPEIGELGNLQSLGLSGNQLSSLPPEISQLRSLKYLDLSNNQFINLPPEIGQISNLTGLNLSGNQLTSLPREIGELQNLHSLNLSGNQLTSLPREIGELQNLHSLNLSGNQLTNLPPEVGKLSNLTDLNLDNNPLSGPLPEFLINLPLERLEFSKTDLCVPADEDFQEWIKNVSPGYISERPYIISDLCSLAEKDQIAMTALYNTLGRPEEWSLQTLPCTWNGVGCDFAGHVVSLFLWSAKFDQLPPEIGLFSHLQLLRLSSQLTELPPEIGNLHNLTELDLRNNHLTNLPPEIGQLTNLQILILSNNQLTTLSPEISQLAYLKTFDISNNPLSGPLPFFLTKIPLELFLFEHTSLCVPDDKAILGWLARQDKGYYNAENGKFVFVPPDPQKEVVKRLLENRGCK
jgi:Leucine-rich repeat (LRR) protein